MVARLLPTALQPSRTAPAAIATPTSSGPPQERRSRKGLMARMKTSRRTYEVEERKVETMELTVLSTESRAVPFLDAT